MCNRPGGWQPPLLEPSHSSTILNMKQPKTCIVVTTINAGGILDGYCKQAEAEGVKDGLQIIVIPDRKTPNELFTKCDQVRAQGFNIQCPTVEEQDAYLKKFGALAQLVA